MAGMALVCQSLAKDFEKQAKSSAAWTDRTANARQGILGECKSVKNNHTIYLSYGVSYGGILENGSKPHIITPKNRKALYWEGASHPVKEVNHPGTKGFKTLENVLENNRNKVIETMKYYWE